MTRPLRLVLDAVPHGLDVRTVGGIGLRLAELAQTLAAHADVTVVTAPVEDPVDTGAARLVDPARWAQVVAQADAVLLFDGSTADRVRSARAAGAYVVVENAPPIEQLEYPSTRRAADPAAVHAAVLADYRAQLAGADHFLCRSTVERLTLLGNLAVTGRITAADLDRSRTLEHRVTVVPLGYSAASAARADATDRVPGPDLLWTGGLWTYFDPVPLVEAVATSRRRGHEVTACFMYAQPGQDTDEPLRALRAAVHRAGVEDLVTLLTSPPSHRDRDALVKSAGTLVALARPGVENETCVRLRIRDTRLFGIPLMCDPFGPTATEATADGMGVVVDPRDPEAMVQTLIARTRKGVPRDDGRRRLPQYCYDSTVVPLLEQLERHAARSARRAG